HIAWIVSNLLEVSTAPIMAWVLLWLVVAERGGGIASWSLRRVGGCRGGGFCFHFCLSGSKNVAQTFATLKGGNLWVEGNLFLSLVAFGSHSWWSCGLLSL